MMIWRLLASVFGTLSISYWIVVLAFLLLAVTPPAWLSARCFLARPAKSPTNARPPTARAGPPTWMPAVP